MTCSSGSVQAVANKTLEAKKQIDKLHLMIELQNETNKAKFFNEINKHLADAKVEKASVISFSSDIKTEYTSEFSLDKIAAVVTSALKAAAAAKDPDIKDPVTSPEAIQAYTDVVNTVAEAAKSSSTASASLSFSMNRLSPGMFAFLYASSVSIKDEDTFGSEAITTTAIYYQFMQSSEDVQNEAEFGATLIDARNYLKMKTIQAGYTEQLSKLEIDIQTWMKLDEQMTEAVEKLKKRLDAHKAKGLLKSGTPALTKEDSMRSAANQEIVRDAIQRLTAKGEAYKVVAEISKTRLANLYY